MRAFCDGKGDETSDGRVGVMANSAYLHMEHGALCVGTNAAHWLAKFVNPESTIIDVSSVRPPALFSVLPHSLGAHYCQSMIVHDLEIGHIQSHRI